MAFERPFWKHRIAEEFKKKSILWLAGPRRTGKTTLCKQIPDGEYFNCDLPRVQAELADPEHFLSRQKSKLLVLDEIHQLPNASQVLKIAADEFPRTRIIATGSSTLVAGKKFQDALTDRKRTLIFPPVLLGESEFYSDISLEQRLARGGCPPALLADQPAEDFYADWMDSFYSRDILEIFKVEKRQPFMDALRFLFQRNGGLLDVSAVGREVGISRPTAIRYLDILEIAQAIRVVPPFSLKDANELKAIPKAYGFDTGFVCYCKGIQSLSAAEKGDLLENLVLDELLTQFRKDQIFYWRTKTGHEVDFVVKVQDQLHCLEVKSSHKAFSPKSIAKFRALYPKGKNILLAPDVLKASSRTMNALDVEFQPLTEAHALADWLRRSADRR